MLGVRGNASTPISAKLFNTYRFQTADIKNQPISANAFPAMGQRKNEQSVDFNVSGDNRYSTLTQEEIQEIKNGASLKVDEQGNTYLDIHYDILDGIPKNKWRQIVNNIFKIFFPKGFYLNGEFIEVSGKGRKEFVNSGDSQWLRSNTSKVYADKLRTSPYLDKISLTANTYEENMPNHERKDDIVKFDVGIVSLK